MSDNRELNTPVSMPGVFGMVVSAVAVLIGLGMVATAVTFGSCDAFGGRCPSDPPPLLEDDVFGMAAFGAAIGVAIPVFATRPSRRRFLIALGAGVAAALVVGFLARSMAHT